MGQEVEEAQLFHLTFSSKFPREQKFSFPFPTAPLLLNSFAPVEPRFPEPFTSSIKFVYWIRGVGRHRTTWGGTQTPEFYLIGLFFSNNGDIDRTTKNIIRTFPSNKLPHSKVFIIYNNALQTGIRMPPGAHKIILKEDACTCLVVRDSVSGFLTSRS